MNRRRRLAISTRMKLVSLATVERCFCQFDTNSLPEIPERSLIANADLDAPSVLVTVCYIV